jgi:hypothetical protein
MERQPWQVKGFWPVLSSRYRPSFGLLSTLPGDDAFFWRCHESNISSPARRRRFPVPLETLRNRIGTAWLDTDERLDALPRAFQVPRE